MPVVYRCSRCGYILFVFVRVGQNSYGVPTPSELANQYGGVCPMCGKQLNTKPTLRDIKIREQGVKELINVLREAKKSMKISFRGVINVLKSIPNLSPEIQSLLAEIEA